MRITGFRCITTYRDWRRPVGDVNGYIESGITEVPIVLVDTDAGITGVGLGSHSGVSEAFNAIEGEDPRGVSALYDRMLARVFKAGHAGQVFGGIGTLDSALWDIKAKAAGEPLWRLLGGRNRSIPGYASGLDIALDDGELNNFYASMADRGFTSGKLKGGADLATDIRRLGIVLDALANTSSAPGLMLDANESWNLKQAVRYVSEIEATFDLTWIEEPLRRWDAQGHARLSSSVRAAVATGENLSGLEQYQSLFDLGGIDIVQAAAVWGVTHFQRVALAAYSRNLPVSPVGLTLNSAVAHAATAVPNHLAAEVQDLESPFGVTEDISYEGGCVVLGDEPGSGISIDEAAIASDQRIAQWTTSAGPHVRSSRSGLRLTPER